MQGGLWPPPKPGSALALAEAEERERLRLRSEWRTRRDGSGGRGGAPRPPMKSVVSVAAQVRGQQVVKGGEGRVRSGCRGRGK